VRLWRACGANVHLLSHGCAGYCGKGQRRQVRRPHGPIFAAPLFVGSAAFTVLWLYVLHTVARMPFVLALVTLIVVLLVGGATLWKQYRAAIGEERPPAIGWALWAVRFAIPRSVSSYLVDCLKAKCHERNHLIPLVKNYRNMYSCGAEYRVDEGDDGALVVIVKLRDGTWMRAGQA
jgi:hypothetical protein